MGRLVCARCGRCWAGAGRRREVDSLRCSGCPQRSICSARPTWLVAERTSRHVLRDGTNLLVRPVLPSDRDELARGYERLSPEARRLRFFNAPNHLSGAELDYLTVLDPARHLAWAAFDLDDPERRGVGVARCIRHHQRPEVAEAAVTVLDDYQGRGIGSLLLEILADDAVAHGVRSFDGRVLWENETILDPLRQLGARITPDEPGVALVEIDLPGPGIPVRESAVFRLLQTAARLARGAPA